MAMKTVSRISQKDRTSYYEKSFDVSTDGNILIEDWIQKKSRYLGSWRSRWAVLKRYNFTFVLCTFKNNYHINYSSYKTNKVDAIKPTEVLIIDYNTIITTHDGSNKQYTTDRFNIYLSGSNERCQLKIDPENSRFNGSDWIRNISKAKLISQQLLHRMIPYYILAYCSRKYLNKTTFPYEITQIIIEYINQSYNINNINMTIWKWNRYHLTFNIETRLFDSNNNCGYYYFLCNKAISKGNKEALVDHTIFSIDNDNFYKNGINEISSSILTDPFDLKLNFDKNPYRQHTKIIYHKLPSILENNNDLLLPSLTYHDDCLFVIGGSYRSQNEYTISSSIYFLDFNAFHWKWNEIKSNKISNAKYGCSALFIDAKKLMIIGGWNMITKSTQNTSRDVSLIRFTNNDYDEFDIMELKHTQRGHTFGGICKNIGFDENKIAIASQRYLEIYDLNKDLWTLYGWKTKVIHYRPQLWIDKKDKNIIYIAGNGADRIEWIDIREKSQFRCFKYTHCISNPTQNILNFNHYRPSVVVL